MSQPGKTTSVAVAIANAIETSDLSYELVLTRLVDGVHTYTLTLDDGSEPIHFDDIQDGYAHLAEVRRRKQAEAVMSALSKVVEVPEADDVGKLLKAAEYIRPYLEYTVGAESPYHHPTMPSAVAAFMASVNEVRDRRLAALAGR